MQPNFDRLIPRDTASPCVYDLYTTDRLDAVEADGYFDRFAHLLRPFDKIWAHMALDAPTEKAWEAAGQTGERRIYKLYIIEDVRAPDLTPRVLFAKRDVLTG
ncbi:MAG: hypothetical protein ACFB3T_05280 [Geminicoccaceae bacterium]